MDMEQSVDRKPCNGQCREVSAGRGLHGVSRQHPAIGSLRYLALAPGKQRHDEESSYRNANSEITDFRLNPKEQRRYGSQRDDSRQSKEQNARPSLGTFLTERNCGDEGQKGHTRGEQFHHAVRPEGQERDAPRLLSGIERYSSFDQHPDERDSLKPQNSSGHRGWSSAAAIVGFGDWLAIVHRSLS